MAGDVVDDVVEAEAVGDVDVEALEVQKAAMTGITYKYTLFLIHLYRTSGSNVHALYLVIG